MLIIYKRNHSSNEWNERIAYCASSSSNIILHLLKKFEGNDFRRREKKAETISKCDFFKKKIQLAARKRPLNFCFSLSRSPLPFGSPVIDIHMNLPCSKRPSWQEAKEEIFFEKDVFLVAKFVEIFPESTHNFNFEEKVHKNHILCNFLWQLF